MSATAVLLAGSRPGGDPLAQELGLQVKAMIPVGGEPMIGRPLSALRASKAIGQIRVLSQDVEALRTAVGRAKSVRLQRSEGTIASTLLALMFDKSIQWPLVVTTADHALLEPAMIDQLLTDADGADVAVAVVEQTALMQRLPQTRRTWLKFRNGAYTGANLFVFGSPKAAAAIEIWRSVEQDRKKGWRMIAALGPMTLIGTALRLLTIDQTAARLGRKLGLNVRIVRMADPLAGIDVDKLDDLKLVEAIVAGRA